MKLLIQRVDNAHIDVERVKVASIGKGLLIFVGFENGDREQALQAAVEKICHLRVFDNDQGKPHFSILETDHEILLVSQFTLCASLHKGRRPDFTQALDPIAASSMYNKLALNLREKGLRVQLGVFGAAMKVSLTNDGPFTLWWQSKVGYDAAEGK